MSIHLSAALASCLAASSFGAAARAADADPNRDPVPPARLPAAEPPAAPSPPRPPSLEWRVRWSDDWPRFRLWEYAGTAAVGATSWYVRNYHLPPQQARWQGDNWFDDTLRGWLRAAPADGRMRAQYASDRLAEIGYEVPFAIDLPVALLVHRRPGVAWQLAMMDLEAFAVAGLVNNFLFSEVGRGRPSAHDCAVNPSYDKLCGIGANASMPSGHVLTIATGAGLTCVHHRYLALYGHAAADGSACGFMVLATLATAATRIMADRHYATDDLAGIAIGFGSGYGLPWLLHYRSRASGAPADDRGRAPSVALAPFGGRGRIGLGLAGPL